MLYQKVLSIVSEDIDLFGSLENIVLPFFYFYTIRQFDNSYEFKDKIKQLSKRYNSDQKDIKVIVNYFIDNDDPADPKNKQNILNSIKNIKNKKRFFDDLLNQRKFLQDQSDNDFLKIFPIKLFDGKNKEINKINYILTWNK